MRILVIHRNPEIAGERARRLCQDGLEASAYPVLGPSAFRLIRADPPDAILIDLTELPSYGRTMATLLREQKSTRGIPLVFLKGDPEKSARVLEIIPDAVFADWPNVTPAVVRAIKRTPQDPPPLRKPQVPVAQKLKIREGTTVGILNAPADFRKILGPVPAKVKVVKEIDEAPLILFFAKSAAGLGRELPGLAGGMKPGRTLWICWPKRSSGVRCDLTPNLIREMASFHNLVDSKLCCMDETWSATALTIRRARR